eukprot:7624677-Alexandrium_andersonii.AAC.1
MSASLVGSEMCIRDRADVLPGARPARAPTPPSRPAATGPACRRAPGGACLLYTSDAADDM